MITLNQVAGTDSDIIWIVRINLDTEYMYFSTKEDKLTLSGIDFDGKVIRMGDDRYPSMTDLDKQMNVLAGGNIGTVASMDFELARYTSYAGAITTFASFFNDFYPATSKPLLTSKEVKLGICWEGATLTSEITYFWTGYIEDYSWDDHSLKMFCIERDELSAVDLPYYKIQDNFDDGISYYTNAPETSYGMIIPIVYGQFYTFNDQYGLASLSPAVKIHKTDYVYKLTSHICHTINSKSELYRYLNGTEFYEAIIGASAASTNNRAGYLVTLNSGGSRITGRYYIQPKGNTTYDASADTGGGAWEGTPGGTTISSAFDSASDSYATLAPGETVAFILGTDLSTNVLGASNGVSADSNVRVGWDASGGNVNMQVKLYHPNNGVNSGYYSRVGSASGSGTGYTTTLNFGDGNYDYEANPTKRDNIANWTIEELQELQFHVKNLDTSAGSIRIKNIWFQFDNISVYADMILWTGTLLPIILGAQTQQPYRIQGLQRMKLERSFASSEVYGFFKGYMFDYWVI